jgi:hypothetical protein
MYYKWIRLNFFYLVLAAIIGLLMRSDPGSLILIPYQNLLHTHSHITFLGWVYPTLFILLINSFLSKEQLSRFKWQLVLTHILIGGMLVSFLIQGYAFYSILFSSLFQVMNYIFIFSFLSALKKNNTHPVAKIFVKIALGCLFLSTLGPWALGAVMASGAGKSTLYNVAIYFYLHFQYNGWMLFALFALFFKYASPAKNSDEIKRATQFLTYMSFAIIPGYCLSLLNIFHTALNFSLAALSAVLQLQAFYYFVRFLMLKKQQFAAEFNDWPARVMAFFILAALAVKIFLQLLSIVPVLTDLAFNNHNIIIAYLHLTMLGIISACLFLFLNQNKVLNLNSRLSKTALMFFIAGFVVTEIVLGFQFSGFIVYSYKNVLAIFSALLCAGIILLLPGFKKAGNHENG